jgi:hypothetical protein
MKDKLIQSIENKLPPIYSNLYRLLRKLSIEDMDQQQRDSYIGLIHQKMLLQDYINNHWLFGEQVETKDENQFPLVETVVDDEAKALLDNMIAFITEHDNHLEKLKSLTENQRQVLYKEQAQSILSRIEGNPDKKREISKLINLINKDKLTFDDKVELDKML